MVKRNSEIPEVLDIAVDELLDEMAAFVPVEQDIESAKKIFDGVKAKVAARFVMIKLRALRTNVFDELHEKYKDAQGANDEIKMIRYLADGRFVSERMINAANQMGSVISVIVPTYNKLEEPSFADVLAAIDKRGTVPQIHDAYVLSEKKRLAAERTAEAAKVKKTKEELAKSQNISYEQYLKQESDATLAAKRAANKPQRDKLLESIMRDGEVQRIGLKAPDETVFVMIDGKLVMLPIDSGLTMLDAVA